MKIEMMDISAQTYGKYQFCTQAEDGMWYADSDFGDGGGCGPLKRGALPAPHQDTPELTAKAKAMHEASARKVTAKVLGADGAKADEANREFHWPSLWLGVAMGSVACLFFAALRHF